MYQLDTIRLTKLISPVLILLLLAGSGMKSDQQGIEQVEVRAETYFQVESLIPDHPGTFGILHAVDFDRDGNLYVLDASDALVLKLNPEMQLTSCFGGKGHRINGRSAVHPCTVDAAAVTDSLIHPYTDYIKEIICRQSPHKADVVG